MACCSVGSQRDETFTKPAVPPESRVANKLADEILKTGESTRELIALGDTPVIRTRTRSAARNLPYGDDRNQAFTVEKTQPR